MELSFKLNQVAHVVLVIKFYGYEYVRHFYSMGASINHVDSWGGGGSQMTILLHKSYLVKMPTKAGRGQNTQKFEHVVYGWLQTKTLHVESCPCH